MADKLIRKRDKYSIANKLKILVEKYNGVLEEEAGEIKNEVVFKCSFPNDKFQSELEDSREIIEPANSLDSYVKDGLYNVDIHYIIGKKSDLDRLEK